MRQADVFPIDRWRQFTLKRLFVVSLLPGLLAVALLGYQYFRQERARYQEEMLYTARALVQVVDRELAASEAILQALATSQSLQTGDLAGFHARATALLANFPADNVVLSDPTGRQLVNLKRPYGEPLPPVADLDLVRRIVETKQPVVSGIFRGNVMQRLVVAYGVPVIRDGKVAYVLLLARLPERINKILVDQQFPEGWIAGIFDESYTFIARTRDPERFVGQKAVPDAQAAFTEMGEGVRRITTPEGVEVVGAFSRSRLSGWTVAIGVPVVLLRINLWRSFAPQAFTMLFLIVTGLSLAWLSGAYITRALRRLGNGVEQALGGQGTAALPTVGPREVVQLAEHFTRMLQVREQAEAAMRQSERLYRSLFTSMLNGFSYCRMLYEDDTPRDLIFLSVNPAFESLTGLKDVVGRRASEAVPGLWENNPDLLAIYGRVARSGLPEEFEIYIHQLQQWLSISAYSPQPDYLVAVFDVITERKEQQAKIDRLVRIYAMLSGINSVIVRNHERQALLDAACRVAVDAGHFGMAWIGLCNPDGKSLRPVAACGVSLSGLPEVPISAGAEVAKGQGAASEALASKRAVFCNDVTRAPLVGPVRAQALKHGYGSVCVLPIVVDGQSIGIMNLYARGTDFFDPEEMKLLDELAADVSFALQYVQREEQLHYLAYYDALTGLPNRMLFLDRLTQLILLAKGAEQAVAIIQLDLDRFTHINETYGRHFGDALLRDIAERLKGVASEPFSLARIGADNFAMAVGNLDKGTEAAATVEEQIFQIFNQPFVFGDVQIHVAAHAGIALYPGDGDNAESLFQGAEAALKEAQAAARQCLYYAPEINARMAANLTLERELRTALDAGQLVMHFQPRVALRSGEIVGAEALIRWQHPERGLVPPVDFIPLAEQNGLIVPIGAWGIEAVCAQQAAWLAEGLNIVPVAINLSPVQFAHHDMLSIVESALTRHGLDAKYLEMELTENLVMDNTEAAAQTMQHFRNFGLRLALDDFGTGYSSLAYLQRFPFDFVKIDRAFISDITENPANAAIATAVIAMAHRLKLRVVAEGVETEGQMRYLRQHDCDQIQGFYFSPALPAADFVKMLRSAQRLSVGPTPEEEQRRTVLIVDDEPNILAALNRALRREGYRVLTASSGKEGLELLALHSVQVIISDQRMPNMSGSEFLSIVKEIHPDTIRIILSGYTDLQVVTDAVNRGAVYKFLTKPWDDEVLKEHIREAFQRLEAGALRRRKTDGIAAS